MIVATFFVALAALVATVWIFWFDRLKPSKLKLSIPDSFAVALDGTSPFIRLRLPLAFESTGAKSVIVRIVQLDFPEEDTFTLPLTWTTIPLNLRPATGEIKNSPSPIVIRPREVKQVIVEFGGPWLGFVPQLKPYRVLIQAFVSGDTEPRILCDFTLHLENVTNPDQYLVWNNTPTAFTADQRIKMNNVWKTLIEQLEQQRDSRETDT